MVEVLKQKVDRLHPLPVKYQFPTFFDKFRRLI
jgi:hypothetical protein